MPPRAKKAAVHSEILQFKGRQVTKFFKNHGFFKGVVTKVDARDGEKLPFFVRYEDGDSEWVSMQELSSILDTTSPALEERPHAKRARDDDGLPATAVTGEAPNGTATDSPSHTARKSLPENMPQQEEAAAKKSAATAKPDKQKIAQNSGQRKSAKGSKGQSTPVLEASASEQIPQCSPTSATLSHGLQPSPPDQSPAAGPADGPSPHRAKRAKTKDSRHPADKEAATVREAAAAGVSGNAGDLPAAAGPSVTDMETEPCTGTQGSAALGPAAKVADADPPRAAAPAPEAAAAEPAAVPVGSLKGGAAAEPVAAEAATGYAATTKPAAAVAPAAPGSQKAPPALSRQQQQLLLPTTPGASRGALQIAAAAAAAGKPVPAAAAGTKQAAAAVAPSSHKSRGTLPTLQQQKPGKAASGRGARLVAAAAAAAAAARAVPSAGNIRLFAAATKDAAAAAGPSDEVLTRALPQPAASPISVDLPSLLGDIGAEAAALCEGEADVAHNGCSGAAAVSETGVRCCMAVMHGPTLHVGLITAAGAGEEEMPEELSAAAGGSCAQPSDISTACAQQMRRILARLDSLLRRSGMDKHCLLSIRIYCAPIAVTPPEASPVAAAGAAEEAAAGAAAGAAAAAAAGAAAARRAAQAGLPLFKAATDVWNIYASDKTPPTVTLVQAWPVTCMPGSSPESLIGDWPALVGVDAVAMP